MGRCLRGVRLTAENRLAVRSLQPKVKLSVGRFGYNEFTQSCHLGLSPRGGTWWQLG